MVQPAQTRNTTLIWRDSQGREHDLTTSFGVDQLDDSELLYLHGLLALVQNQLSNIGVHRLRAIRESTE